MHVLPFKMKFKQQIYTPFSCWPFQTLVLGAGLSMKLFSCFSFKKETWVLANPAMILLFLCFDCVLWHKYLRSKFCCRDSERYRLTWFFLKTFFSSWALSVKLERKMKNMCYISIFETLKSDVETMELRSYEPGKLTKRQCCNYTSSR